MNVIPVTPAVVEKGSPREIAAFLMAALDGNIPE
jgi:hypothetical protein